MELLGSLLKVTAVIYGDVWCLLKVTAANYRDVTVLTEGDCSQLCSC